MLPDGGDFIWQVGMNYTIENFWKKRLPTKKTIQELSVQGWFGSVNPLATFTEAPLGLSSLPTGTPEDSSILLVSAPGAVGKTTLARQIAANTGAVYIDLATAAPVGGNAITGGLVKSGILSLWENEDIALLIDGLDEARLRVTQEAYASFLDDVAELSKNHKLPIALFGRTGAVQDSWIILDDKKSSVSILEIGYYNQEAAIDFTMAQVRGATEARSHVEKQKEAIQKILERLRKQTTNDGDRFSGYAPVLQAVAQKVIKEENYAALISSLERGEQPVTLQTVVSSIMDRERSKLASLQLQDAGIVGQLYLPEEQLQRLAARIYKTPPPQLPVMLPKDTETYSSALETWVDEHPFLDGASKPSSAAFDAAITACALRRSSVEALQSQLSRGAAANPFLAEFYLPQEGGYIPLEHVGVVYSSMRARLSLGDTASLTMEGAEDAEDVEELAAEIEITVTRKDTKEIQTRRLSTNQVGCLFLGNHVEDVNIAIPHGRIEVGPGREATFVAPVNIQCKELVIQPESMAVEPSMAETLEKSATVFFETDSFKGININTVPTVRNGATLAVNWPNSKDYPWTGFSTNPLPSPNPEIKEALRRFRKFVISFRSHSKGELARFKDKIEHARMTKGTGRAVLDFMIKEEILSLKSQSDPMYVLDPDRLAEKTGATYKQCMAHDFKQGTLVFLEKALESSKADTSRVKKIA